MIHIDNPSSTPISATIARIEVKKLTADATTTASTVQPLPDLTVALLASKTYYFEYQLSIGQDNTGGIRFTLAAPSGATIKGNYLASTTGATVQVSVNFTSFSEFAVVQNAANDNGFMRITGYVTLSTTAGDMTIGYRSATSTQESRVFDNSRVKFEQIV